jgi:hypothetical protein
MRFEVCMPLLLLLACAGMSPEPSPPGPADTDDGYLGAPADDVPRLDADEVSVAVQEAIEAVLFVDPALFLDAYAAALSQGDEACPYWHEEYPELYGYEYWYGDCTTADGTAFSGYATGLQYAQALEANGYVYFPYGQRAGDMSVDTADGQHVDMSGSFYHNEWVYPANGTFGLYSYVLGEMTWEGPAFDGTWLSRQLSVSLTLSGTGWPGGAATLQVQGGVAGYDGVGSAAWFDRINIASEAYGSDCPLEPSGSLSVRDADDEWYTIAFDGPSFAGAEAFAPACDGCGTIWYHGRDVGQACADFSPMTAWQDRPW